MYMKKSIFLSFLLSSCLFVTAQSLDLQKLSEKKRNKHLVETAKEVTMAFAPEYYREYKKPIILGPYDYDPSKFPSLENRNQYIGRSYYVVIIPYDFSKENLDRDYAARIQIWADDGTPMTFMASGSEILIHFLRTSFKQIKQEGIPKELKVPYKERTSRIFDTNPELRYRNPHAKRSWERFDEEYKEKHKKNNDNDIRVGIN